MNFFVRHKREGEEQLVEGLISVLGVVGIETWAYAFGQLRIQVWIGSHSNIIFEC